MSDPVEPATRDDMAERARQVYNREPAMYGSVDLHPAERRLLAEVGPGWGHTAMLDLGIGTGRTTLTFGAICREYVGIDYASEMVRIARERCAAIPRARIEQGDARAMPEFADGRFDVVLFSFNGLDALDHAGRQQALREMARVLRPGGRLVFSSHTLVRRRLDVPPVRMQRPISSLRVALGAVRYHYRFLAANRGIDLDAATGAGHAVFLEGHDFQLPQYYVTPAECGRQVAAAGLELSAVVAMDGADLPPPYATTDPWVFYWCRRPA